MSHPTNDRRLTTARAPLARTLATIAAAATALAGAVLAPAAATAAVSPDAPVVISEVYGGGGNSGAAFNRDFVELANVGDADVDLSSYSVQYASAAGGTWQVTPLTGVVLPAGGFLLVGQAFGNNTGLPGFTADVDGSIPMSGSAGKVALVSTQQALSGATGLVGLDQVVDFVGWGGAGHFAGTGAAPATTNAESVARDATLTNTADNAADFAKGAPTPQGLQSGTEEPGGPEEPEEPQEPELVAIAEIQGTGDASPRLGQTVTTTGVVTAHYPTGGLNGYVVQTPGTGGEIDLATHTASHAIFVYAPGGLTGDVALGDTVEVTGVVSEYYGLTQITATAGSARVIDAAEAPVPASIGWPATAEERERFESMLVAPQGAFTVSNTYSTNQYGEVGLAAGTTPLRQPTDLARPGSPEAAAIAADNAARAVALDDGTSINFLNAANSGLVPAYVSLAEPVVVGASVEFTAPFIVDYRNDTWKLNPTRPLLADGSGADDVVFGNPRTAAPDEVGGDLSIASFNVLNYFTTLGNEDPACVAYTDRFGDGVTVREGCAQRGAWDADDLARQQAKIVEAIGALDADVVGLMEIENSAALGEETDEATATLVAALNAAAGAEKWAFVPSSAELPSPAEQDVITNAIIYQPAVVTPQGASRALGDQSGAGQAFGNAREPIAQVFAPAAGGEPFLFVVNHFKSKGSAGPWPGDADTGDGQGASNESRVRQATALRDWVAAVRGDVAAVALAGDFNSYGHEDPLQVLYDAGYANAEQVFGVATPSYSYQGLSGSLDHVLLNGAALERATGADIWNINSGESVALEYSRFRSHGIEFYAPDVYRSSDHDPVVVGLTAGELPVAQVSTTTRLGALLPLHVNRILPTTLIATVATADRTAPSGAVEFREGDTLIATVPVRHGLATHRLGTLSRGTHRYTATFVPSDPALYAGSVSDPAPVRVLF
ncbi:ExeM/NucH family extracellular endonuclease [Microbacterium sp. No. 7]|uniref:ExeM/NucH family extracellular endonuclease n=1 Tax=Microbacterium sp. No. 7 TaxID=1714373 RepID=UPI0006CFA79F